MLEGLWRISLLGGISASCGQTIHLRFRTTKVAALLAYLAYDRDKNHPRAELCDLFWPDDDIENGRRSLRVALNSLRRQLEPHPNASEQVLLADHHSIRLNPDAYITDVFEFDAWLHRARAAAEASKKREALESAVALYVGDLMPGFDDDYCDAWVTPERNRLQHAHLNALRELITLHEQEGPSGPALDYALRLLKADAYDEFAYQSALRQYLLAGRFKEGLACYRKLEKTLQALNAVPQPVTQALAARLDRRTTLSHQTSERLREFASPIYSTPEAPAPAVRPRSDNTTKARLPVVLTRFFGREAECARLLELLKPVAEGRHDRYRPALVTLFGYGGAGKTRLAVEVGRRIANDYHERVTFVPLADLQDPHAIPEAILDALSLSRSAMADPLDQIVAELATEPALLILDNYEHLAAAGAHTVLKLLHRLPMLTLLITSRRRLALSGEVVFAVPPLLLPRNNESLETLARLPCVQLFMDRVRAVVPDFQINRNNGEAVGALCRQLEGLPLALELAAARASLLSPHQMLDKFQERFQFLKSKKGTLQGRHDSLQNVIDWSYDLLSPELKRFFSGLCVFRNGFEESSVRGIFSEETESHTPAPFPDADRIPDYLYQLQAFSMIVPEPDAATMRYRLLESLREYAEQKLSPELKRVLTQRHAEWFLALAEQSVPHMHGTEQGKWLKRLEQEHDNLRRALLWFETNPEGARSSLRLAKALQAFWSARGHFREAKGWLQRALARPCEGVEELRPKAINALGNMLNQLGNYPDAKQCYEEALQLFRDLDQPQFVANLLTNLADLSGKMGETGRQLTLMQESLAIYRQIGDEFSIGTALSNIGGFLLDTQNYEAALVHLEEGRALLEPIGATLDLASLQSNLAEIAVHLNEFDKAKALYRQCITTFAQLESDLGLYLPFFWRGVVAFKEGQPRIAAQLFGAFQAAYTRIGLEITHTLERSFDTYASLLKHSLTESEFLKELENGKTMSTEAAVQLALR